MRIRAIGDTAITHRLGADLAAYAAGGPDDAIDLSIGNLEIPLTDETWPSDKVSVHRSLPENVSEYVRLGVDVWSIATNHALDYGIPGLFQTLDVLTAAGVAHVGAGRNLAEASAALEVEARNGDKVGVLNFCSTLGAGSVAGADRPGVSPMRVGQSFEFDGARMDEQPGSPPRMNTWVQEVDAARAERLVAQAAEGADHVVVSLHWGVAWAFLPPNQGPLADYQRPLAHRLIDAGARVVLGTHSHALHPIEFYGGGVILYSMGNFLFHDNQLPLPPEEQRITPAFRPILRTGPWAEGAIFDIDLDDAGVVVRATPIVLDADGEPRIATGERRTEILAGLSRASAEHDSSIRHQDGVFQL